MNYKEKNAQVLLITLLVLTIVGIVVVGIVTLSNRDVQQVVTTEKYEKLYNTSETELRKLVDAFGRYDIQLDASLTTKFTYCTPKQATVEYDCALTDTASTPNSEIRTTINVANKREVIDYEVKKDKSFVLNVTGYNSGLDIRFDRPAALEFSLIAREAAAPRNLKVIKGVYDLSGVYDSLVGSDPYNDTTNIHAFNYTPLSGDPAVRQLSTRIIINAANIAGLAGTDVPLYLSITPRIRGEVGSVKLSVVPQTTALLYQVREFTSSTYDAQDTNTPNARLVTKIPLTPQIETVFDYSILTNGVLSPF